MLATVVALAGALAIAGAYLVLAEHMDYGTLSRRQLDAWVALGGLACLVAILLAGADARRELDAMARSERALLQVARPIARQRHPDLTRDYAVADAASQPPAARTAQSVGRDSDAAAAPGGTAPYMSLRRPASMSAPFSETVSPTAGPSATDDAPVKAEGVTAVATASPTPSAVRLPSATPLIAVVPTQTKVAVVATLTRRLPTSVAETPEPPPAATSTPRCGDPYQIRLRLDLVEASVDTSAREFVVHYAFRVRNDSTFPATMADVVVTAISHSTGGETYGHRNLRDISLEPGAVVQLEGELVLTKNPPVFVTTDLCVTFVGETCGRRPAFQVVRKCARVNGL